MKLKYKMIIIALICVFLFPQSVRAFETSRLYYFSYDEDGTEHLNYQEFKFYSRFLPEEKAFIIFYTLFENSEEYHFVPPDVSIITVFLRDGNLYLNVSDDIRGYGGGSSYELRLITQIVMTALNIPCVESMTLLINGFEDYLPEGSLIIKENIIPLYK